MKAIVLASDRGYIEQVTTTIKSILYHNQNVKIYVLNTDFAPEWFHMMNAFAQQIGSELVNIHIGQDILHEDWETRDHITPIAYARFHIPDLISEDRVLYLDSDIIVNGALDAFFEVDLQGYPLAAIRDADGSGFNSGVLLIDHSIWRQEHLSDQLVAQAKETTEQFVRGEFQGRFNGDQTILNQVFTQRWLELDKRYNLQVGHDVVAFFSGWTGQFTDCDAPLVIHYTTEKKPWNSIVGYRYRELWWQFYRMSLEQLLGHVLEKKNVPLSPFVGHRNCLTLTASQDLSSIRELVESLPDVYFHIAAYSAVGPVLLELRQYANVRIYPTVVPPVLNALKALCDVYLDINYSSEVDDIIAQMNQLNKPILAFSDTAKGQQGQMILSLDEMKSAIQGKDFKPLVTVRDISASLDFILSYHPSVVRYGDGEMDIMTGHSIPYQDYDAQLAEQLKEILAKQSDEHLLVCLSDVFEHLERYRPEAVAFWQGHLAHYKQAYQELCSATWYGSTFISRPYIDLADKSVSANYFSRLKQIWERRDIVIVEGKNTRSGSGKFNFLSNSHTEPLIF